MPPKSKKTVEPSDRKTRSKTTTNKPKPKYHYTDEESEAESILSEPNQSRNLNMSDSEEERDENRMELPPLPQIQALPAMPVIPGVSPDMLAFMNAMQQMQQLQQQAYQQQQQQVQQAMQKQMQDAERRAERRMLKAQEESAAAMKLIVNQMAMVTSSRNNKPSTPTVRLPSFDIDRDAKTFPQWKSRWETHITANKLHTIEDDQERNQRQMGELKAALTDNTIRWLSYREMTEQDKLDPEIILKHMEDHIRESINPIVAVVELVTMKRYANETADHLNARIKEKLAQCDFTEVSDIRDYIGLIATIQACDIPLRKRMFYDKVNTHAKASLAVKSEEQANTHSKMLSDDVAKINATSTYKRDQKQERQAQSYDQTQRGRGQSQIRGRGGHHPSSHARDPSQNRQQERGRSKHRSQSQSRSQPQSGACYRCGKTNHDQSDCWFKEKNCLNCGKIGHIAPVCRQPQGSMNARANAIEGSLSTVIGKLSSTKVYPQEILISNTISKLSEKYPPPEPLDTVKIGIKFMQQNSQFFNMRILPDTGANVTAIDISQAPGITLEATSVILKVANGTILNTLGTAEAIISRHGNQETELIFIVKDLSEPLLSRRMLKELNMLHPEWPHQNCAKSHARTNTVSKQPNANTGECKEPPTIQCANSKPQKANIKWNPVTHRYERSQTANTSPGKPHNQHANQSAQEQDPKAELKTSQQAEIQIVGQGQDPQLAMLMNEHKAIFSGKCKPMKAAPHHIELKPYAKPVNTGASRNVPEPQKNALKRELDNLENQGITKPIDQATPWLHPMVIVPKKGSPDLRICVDFTRLNEHVIRPLNPQPTPWEIVRNLPTGCTHFAVFDALKGYYQVELDEESQLLTAFMTPFGRYVYKRLPMGLSSAGDVFTLLYGNATDEATNNLRATEDTLITGRTKAELIENTRKFFKACEKNGITLNTKKIQWDQREVLFGGFIVGPDGYSSDPSLAKALSQFPMPKSGTDVRSFFGLANQLCNFSDAIAEILCPLKSLLKKGTTFQWMPEHEAAFQKARKYLSSNQTLAYYCPRRPTRLISDASKLFGLGFVLKQKQDNGLWMPVQAGSRSITTAEQNYAMCELELLGIVWACKKTQMFTEGLNKDQFEIWTDHAPLVPILNKQTLPEINNKRLQRLGMKLDHLTFVTKWVKGTDNIEADCLSRHPHAQPDEEDELDELIQTAALNMITIAHDEIHMQDHKCQVSSDINLITANINHTGECMEPLKIPYAFTNSLQPADRDLTDDRLRELRLHASEDETYNQIMRFTAKGFPNTPTEEIPEKWRPFFKIREDLTIDSDGFLCRNGQFIVPESLIQTYMQRLHSMHQGAAKMTARARTSLWWPFMTRDISNFAKTCKPCGETKASNPVEAILTHEPAVYPFQYIHMDIGQMHGRYYLITTDQFSGYPHINDTGKTCTTQQAITATIDLITHFSVPEIIYTDGGPQFLQDGAFDKFCQEWGIRHILSSPYMPRSNGHAEAAVKQMKKLIQANLGPNGILNRSSAMAGLQVFRNTPREPTGLSPAVMIFGHSIRDSVPMK